jgi:hypothetical protein
MNNRMEQLRSEIKARGLTADQAASQYGLSPDMLKWLTSAGVSFSPNAQPNQEPPITGLMGAMGRNGDTQVAHVTPGEKVIPKEIAQMRPDLVAHVERAIRQYGGDPSKYTVGAGRRNPETGAQEFATDQEIQNAYRNVLGRDADPDGMAFWRDDTNNFQGGGFNTAAARELAARPAPAPTAAPVGMPGIPRAEGAITPTARTEGYLATTAAGAAPVVAGQGTAQSYQAAQAQRAPDVVAEKAVATNATSQGYQATDANAALRPGASLWDVDSNSTVQGQIGKIVDEGGPMQQRAATRSLQDANKRGMANSTMAITAGQAALYDAALPIAQQDANTYAQSGQFNAGAKNERDQFNAGTQSQVNLANAAERNKAALFGSDSSNKASMFNAENSTKNSQFNVEKALQAGIVNQEQANKMSAINAEMKNRASEFNITTDAQMQQFNIEAAFKAGVINQEQANKMSQFNAAAQNEASQFNASEANKVGMFEANLAADINKFNASENNDLIALGMDSVTKTNLAEIEANYKTLMQTSASASEVYKTAMSQVAAILQNDKMDEAAKKVATDNIMKMLDTSLGVTGRIANLDLELDFGNGKVADTTPAAGSTTTAVDNGAVDNGARGSPGDTGA